MINPNKLKDGDKIRLLYKSWLRRYGVRVGNRIDGFMGSDCIVWPGEIGVIEYREWTAHSGEPMSRVSVEFSRGRHTWLDMLAPDEWVKVPKSKKQTKVED